MNAVESLLGTATVLAGLSGCSALSSRSTGLSVVFFNQNDSSYTIELDTFEAGEESRSEARQYSSSIDVAPDGQTRVEDVAETGS